MARGSQPSSGGGTTGGQRIRIFVWVGIGVAAFHLALYVISCGLLLTQATAVETEFTQDAIKHHGGYMLWSSLSLLRGYAIVSFAYLLVLYPAVLLWMRKRRATRWGIVWRTVLLTAACFTLLFVRLMALRPYFVTQWLPDWHFHIVPGSANVAQQILVWTLANGIPLAGIAAVCVFWVRRGVRFVRSSFAPRYRPFAIGAVAAFAVVAIAPLVTPARGSGGGVSRPNIIIIASDSLRADHLSCNGYGRATSPHIDALAERSINFVQCFTPVGSTPGSRVVRYCCGWGFLVVRSNSTAGKSAVQ